MEHQYQALAENSKWRQDNNVSRNKINEPLKTLITTHGSLTKALTELGSDFSVKVLNQRLALPYFHEQKILKNPLSQQAVIREVELILDNQAIVFARSILPISLVSKTQSGLAGLGENPLGHLLFKKGQMRISKRQFSDIEYKGKHNFARRTPYEYMRSTVLVSEFFLPSIRGFI